jgi:hypothetical protein
MQELVESCLTGRNAEVFKERMEQFNNNFKKPRIKAPVTYDEDGKPRYTCIHEGCGRHFSRNEHFKRHLLIHTGEKPYLCPLCNKTFNRTDNLAEHINIHFRSLLRKQEQAGENQALLKAEVEMEISALFTSPPAAAAGEVAPHSEGGDTPATSETAGDDEEAEEEEEDEDDGDHGEASATALLSLGGRQ